MPRRCFVPGCKSGLLSEKERLKINGLHVPHMFYAPKNKVEEWQTKIGWTAKPLTSTSAVCENHFLPEDILSDWKHTGPDGRLVSIPRERVSLHPDAVPCIFTSLASDKSDSTTLTQVIDEKQSVNNRYAHKYMKMRTGKRTTEENIEEVKSTTSTDTVKIENINPIELTTEADMESIRTCEPSNVVLERIKVECSYDESECKQISEEESMRSRNIDHSKPIEQLFIKKEIDTFDTVMNRMHNEGVDVRSWDKYNLSQHLEADEHEVKVKIEKSESETHISGDMNATDTFDHIKSENEPLIDPELHSFQQKKIYEPIQEEIVSRAFSCYDCSYTTFCKNNLTQHMSVHAGLIPSKYICSQCNRGYQTKSTLDEHTIKHHPKLIASVTSKIHKCTECSYKTVMKPSLARHMLIHPKTASSFRFRYCAHCDASFKSKAALNDHILRKHPDSSELLSCKIYLCANCPYKTTKKDHLVVHMLKHSGAASKYNIFKCQHCNAKFKFGVVLDDHILRKHPNYVSTVSSKIYKCINCAYITTRNSFLTRHILRYCKSVHAYSLCGQCNARFTKKSELDQHISERHANLSTSSHQETFECKKCNYKSTCKKAVAEHMTKHPDAEYSCKSGRCKQCGAKFRDKLRLDEHIIRKHASDSGETHSCEHCTYKCSTKDELADHMSRHIYRNCVHCNRVFKRKIAFDNHIIQKHPAFISSVSSKIHNCKDCTYKTTLLAELRKHSLKHRESASKRKVTCEYCDVMFKRQIALDNHVVKRHPEYIGTISHKLHTCTNCAYKTTIKSNLTKHLLIKHSEAPPIPNPVKCPQCDVVYKSKVTLDDHIVKKHPNYTDLVASKVHECRKCGYKTAIKSGYYKHVLRHCESSLDETNVKQEFPEHEDSQIVEGEIIEQYVPKYSICLHCNVLYKSRTALDHHILKTHPDSIASVTSKINVCSVCGFKTVRSKAILDDHTLQSHPDSISLVTSEIHGCMNCTFKTTVMHKFIKHSATHVIRPAPRFKCVHCNLPYRSQVALDDHIIKHHPNFIVSIHGKIQSCTMCDFKTAKSKPVLDDHILKKHPNSDASVTSQVKECAQCAFKTTKSQTLLDDHVVKKHPEAIASVTSKIYECTQCPLKTTIKCNFSKHQSIHAQTVP